MALNALVASFLPQSKKWGTKRVNYKNLTAVNSVVNLTHDSFKTVVFFSTKQASRHYSPSMKVIVQRPRSSGQNMQPLRIL